jgi:hypothetical protein
VEHLERDLGRIAVQRRRVDGFVVDLAQLLGHQQRGRLREVAVEQLVELVAHVEPGQSGRGQPHRRHQAEHQQQQPRQQRRRHQARGQRPHAGLSRISR